MLIMFSGFGCVCFVHVSNACLDKLDAKVVECIILDIPGLERIEVLYIQ